MTPIPSHRFKGVVFDLDGTLIDSAPDLHAALNRELAKAGRDAVTLEQVKSWVGDGVSKLIERAYGATGRVPEGADLDAAIESYLKDYEANSTVLTHAYPGAEAALKALHADGLALGLCTNKPQAATREVLRGLGLETFFDAIVGGDVLDGIRKPDPRHLLAVVDALGLEAGGTLFIGDSPADIGAAKAARLPVVAVSFGYPKMPVAELGANIVIDDYAELPAAMAALS